MKKIKATTITLCLFIMIAHAQFPQSSFIATDILPAKKIVLVQNDVTAELKDASKFAEDAMRKFWTATKVEFTTKKLSEVNSSKGDELYFGAFAMDDRRLFREGKDNEKWMMFAVGFANRDKEGKLRMNLETEFLFIPKTYNELDVIWVVRIYNQFLTAGLKNQLPKDMRLSPGLAPPLYRLSEANAGVLKTKTLLIDKEAMGKRLDEAGIKEVYPYPFKIVSKEEITKAVEIGDSKYAIYQSVVNFADETGGLISASTVLDAQTGKMLSFSKVTEVTMMVKNTNPGPMLVSKSCLKEIVKNADRKK